MCLTLPGRVVAVDPMGATIDTEGRIRRASTIIVPDVEVGDWVVVGAGSVLQRLDPELALEMRSTLLQGIALEDAEREALAPGHNPTAGLREVSRPRE